jgi:hypothetical protein
MSVIFQISYTDIFITSNCDTRYSSPASPPWISTRRKNIQSLTYFINTRHLTSPVRRPSPIFCPSSTLVRPLGPHWPLPGRFWCWCSHLHHASPPTAHPPATHSLRQTQRTHLAVALQRFCRRLVATRERTGPNYRSI